MSGLNISTPGQILGNPETIITAITWENKRGCASGVTALGTNQATAYQLGTVPAFLEVTTTASGTGVCLDTSTQGDRITVVNNGVSTLTVYTATNEVGVNKINGTAGATGVTQAAGVSAVYFCCTPGQWYRISGS